MFIKKDAIDVVFFQTCGEEKKKFEEAFLFLIFTNAVLTKVGIGEKL